MKRRIAIVFLVGAGLGFTGCQAPSLGSLAFWNRTGSQVASTAPDVGRQKFNGLSQQVGGEPRGAMGQSQAGSAALGASRPAANDNFLTASWKKTTATVSGAMATKPTVKLPEDDPLRLDRLPKKIGPEVYVGAARLLENQGKYVEAEEKYREALRAAPTDLSALVGLARLYDRQGQGSKAIEAYQKAAQAHPSDGLVFNDLGLCYRRQRQLDKSLAAHKKAVELQPENAKYRNNLAGTLVEAGRRDEALQELAAVNAPAIAHYNLAHLLEQKSDRNGAVQHLQQALAIDPGLTPAQDMLNQFTGAGPATTSAAPDTAPRMAMTAREAASPAADAPPAALGAFAAPPHQASVPADPPSYHIGDETSPAASTAQRSNFSSIWLAPTTTDAKSTRPLPPID